MELEGSEAVKYLSGYGSVRDGTLVRFAVEALDSDPVVQLTFEVPQNKPSRVVRLELRQIQEFDYHYSQEDPPTVIEFVKCFMTDAGDFYLSLDPYDEHEAQASERDNEFFRAKIIKLAAHDVKTSM